MASRGPVAASSPFSALDRAFSPPLRPFCIPSLASNLCSKRFYSSLDLDKSPFFIEHFEPHSPHLPIACLAFQLSDCSDRCELPSEINGISCLSGAASLIGLLHVSVIGFKHRSTLRHIRFAEARAFRGKGRPLVAIFQSPGDSGSSHNDGADDGVTSKINPGPHVGAPRILRDAKLVTYCNTETRSHNTLSDTIEDEDGNSKGIKGLKQSSDVESQFNTYQPIPTSQRRPPESPLLEDTFSGRQHRDSTTQRIDTDGQRSGNGVSETGEFGNEQQNSNISTSSLIESVTMTVKEPIYKVLEVNSHGMTVTKSVSRRQLLKSSGLRLRDVRSVDPSLWVTNSMPALLIRDQAILLNLGSLRAIATRENVLIFDHKSIGAAAFLELLLPRLNSDASVGTLTMPFELEVVEAALLSRTQRLERRLMEIEPRVLALLEVLPNLLTANILEELRLSKQALVELGSKAGALRQMLLELLESPQEIRRMTIIGRQCFMRKDDGSIECSASVDKRLADEEEQEMEMLLENYLQRCESCHGQAERLLDSAKETEDSIAVNLSSRRLEVSRLELLLQVGTFCSALGALVAGIFGMNLRSYLEASTIAFWLTTAGIILGGLVLFFVTYNYLKHKRIL